jgi:hypothetical protein
MAKLLIAVPLCLFAAIIEMPADGRGLAAESRTLHLLGKVELTRGRRAFALSLSLVMCCILFYIFSHRPVG